MQSNPNDPDQPLDIMADVVDDPRINDIDSDFVVEDKPF